MVGARGARASEELCGIGTDVGSNLAAQPRGHDAATVIGEAATERNAQVACGVCPHDTLIDGAEPRIEREKRRKRHANTVASPYHGLRRRRPSFRRERSRRVRCGREARHFSPVNITVDDPWGFAWCGLRDDMNVGPEQVIDF